MKPGDKGERKNVGVIFGISDTAQKRYADTGAGTNFKAVTPIVNQIKQETTEPRVPPRQCLRTQLTFQVQKNGYMRASMLAKA
jgi:hypothetical protein